jgi:hypothetical protein
MARRIEGALLITRALGPLFLFAAFAVASVVATREITHAARAYGARVAAQVDTARQTFAEASEGFTALASYVADVKGAVDGVARDVSRLASTVTIPVIDRSIQIPGVTQFRRVVADVAAAGRAAGSEVGKVTALAVVPAQLEEVRTFTQVFAADVKAVVVWWILFVAGVLALALVAWTAGQRAVISGEVRRGWALVRGA